MIELRNVSYHYGQEEALNNVSLDIAEQSTCAVIGPSGCGKTTLLYILAGFLRDFTGSVMMDGREIRGIRKGTSLILQNGGLLPWKTVWDNVALGLMVQKLDRQEIRRKVDAILEELNISEHRLKYPAQLSGGQKQRAAIARTLILEPDLLLLDEATSALDAINKENLQDLILQMYRKRKVTLVMVTHSIEEAVFLGQQIVVMDKGSIRQRMANPYFGAENIRMEPSYFELCRRVRRELAAGEGG